jgi:hypothetical protein
MRRGELQAVTELLRRFRLDADALAK